MTKKIKVWTYGKPGYGKTFTMQIIYYELLVYHWNVFSYTARMNRMKTHFGMIN